MRASGPYGGSGAWPCSEIIPSARIFLRLVLGTFLHNLSRIVLLLEDPRSIPALISWPKFSPTSFLMVSQLSKQGISPRTVIDVGANVGQFSIASAKLFPGVQVHSFEPQPESVKSLRKNVARLSNIKVYPIGLGDREGDVSFHVNTHNQSSSVLPLAQAHRDAFPSAREEKTITVRISTLDQILAKVDFTPLVLLKLDVQGYESQVLGGGHETLNRVHYIVLETSFRPLYKGEVIFRDILQIMEGKGFCFTRPVGWLAAPSSGEVLQIDALFIRS
jgi:FkbM family methyltransferase